MNELEKAEMVARWAHRNQTDMCGLPYWTHCHRVAGNLRAMGFDEAIQAIGWLHDVIEDTDVTGEDLYDLGFSERIVEGVYAMSQVKGEHYFDEYLPRLIKNEDARIVKLYGDIPDNDDIMRKDRALGHGGMSQKLYDRLTEKYARARKFLREFPDEPVHEWTQPELTIIAQDAVDASLERMDEIGSL